MPDRFFPVVLRVTLTGELSDPEDPVSQAFPDGLIALSLRQAIANAVQCAYEDGFTHTLADHIAVSAVPQVELWPDPRTVEGG